MYSTKQITYKFRCIAKLTTSLVISYFPAKDKGLRRCLLLAFPRTVKLHRTKQSVSNDIFSSAPRKYGSIKREQSNTIWTNEQRRSGNGSETWSQWRVSVYIGARVTGPLPLSQLHTEICWCFVTKLTVSQTLNHLYNHECFTNQSSFSIPPFLNLVEAYSEKERDDQGSNSGFTKFS